MIRPDALETDEPLFWSCGRGVDVWELFCAARDGDLPAARRLVDRDPCLVRSAYEYRTALSFAVRENRVEVAAFLIARGADPINSGMPMTLSEIAHDRGYTAMEALLDAAVAGSNGASAGGEAIAAAIRARDLTNVRSFLDGAPDLVHARDQRGNVPIHWAAMTRQVDVIDELLSRGADIDARRGDGARPIQLANGDYTYRGWRDVPKDTIATPRDDTELIVAVTDVLPRNTRKHETHEKFFCTGWFSWLSWFSWRDNRAATLRS
jgi:ankyrin repeat protein